MIKNLSILLVILSSISAIKALIPLDNIRHYYLLANRDFDYTLTENDSEGPLFEIIIRTYGIEAKLTLREDKRVFPISNSVTFVDGKVQIGESEGDAYGTVDRSNPSFYGRFEIDGEIYYLEPPDYFFSDVANYIKAFVYRASDIVLPQQNYSSSDSPSMLEPPKPSSRSGSDSLVETGSICALDLRIDNSLYRSLGQDPKRIRNFIYQLVMALNGIYQSPKLEFVVGRLGVATDEWCSKVHNSYGQCSPTTDVKDLITEFSKDDIPGMCLKYLFTAKDLSGSISGVSFTGGICESNTGIGYNVGIIAIKNQTQYQRELLFAHQIGHSLGARDDDFDNGCFKHNPGPKGNFLMAPSIPIFERSNNRKLSSCSTEDINRIFLDMKSNRRRNCLLAQSPDHVQFVTGAMELISEAYSPYITSFTLLVNVALVKLYSDMPVV